MTDTLGYALNSIAMIFSLIVVLGFWVLLAESQKSSWDRQSEEKFNRGRVTSIDILGFIWTGSICGLIIIIVLGLILKIFG